MVFSIKFNTIHNGLQPEALNNNAISLSMNKPSVGSHGNVDTDRKKKSTENCHRVNERVIVAQTSDLSLLTFFLLRNSTQQ